MVSREIRSFLPLGSRQQAQDGAGGTHNARARGLRLGGLRLGGLLASRVGRALGATGKSGVIDRLEDRVLLDGSPTSPLPLTPGAQGRFTAAQTISSPTDADFFEFVAPANGFVTVLADTSNEVNRNLDSSVRVTLASTGAVVAQGENNGTLTSGFQKDGWAGFVATANTRYIIEVRGQAATQGPYTLRLRGTNFTFSVGGVDERFNPARELGLGFETGTPTPRILNNGLFADEPTPILGQLGGTGPINTRLRQDEIVYRWTAPNEAKFDNLVTVNAQSTEEQLLTQRLDTHLTIYDQAGNQIAVDQQSGRINDAALVFKSTPGQTYFIRVRSDEVSTPNAQLATGPFFLVFDALASNLTLDQISRRAQIQGAFPTYQEPLQQPNPNMPDPNGQSETWSFVAEGSGFAVLTIAPDFQSPYSDLAGTWPAALTNGAVSLYNSSGQRIAFADDTFGLVPQIEAQLVGGEKYFIVIDGFELNAGQAYTIFLESNSTFDSVDDHPNAVGGTLAAARRNFSEATALPWSDPFLFSDADGNPLRDTGLKVRAVGEGRLTPPVNGTADSDVFQFTPPVDMLLDQDGNNDDDGTALYVGGGFDIQGRGQAFPNYSRAVTTFDAADYFATGKQNIVVLNGVPVQQGFIDNPATPATNGPVVHASLNWTPFLGETTALAPRLVVGGDFIYQEVVNGQIVQITNLIVWQLIGGRYQWNRGQGPQFIGGGTDGPVYALAQFNPTGQDPDDGDDVFTPIPDPGQSSLYVGGDFTDPGINLAAFNPVDGWFDPSAATTGSPVPDFDGTEVGSGPVRAFAVFDPQDAGDGREAQDNDPPQDDLDLVRDPGDQPLSLFVGGSFDQGLIGWNGLYRYTLSIGSEPVVPGAPPVPDTPTGDGTPPPEGNIDGDVYSLATFALDLDGYVDSDGTDHDPDPNTNDAPVELLIIGGDFSGVDGSDSPSLLAWGARRVGQETEAVEFSPALEFLDLAINIQGTVHALQVWTPASLTQGVQPTPVLAVGGAFTAGNNANIASFNNASIFTFELNAVGGRGTNGPVYALAAFQDEDEPLQEGTLDSGSTNEALYIGGAFTQIVLSATARLNVNNAAYFSAVTGEGNAPPNDSFSWGSLGVGVEYEQTVAGRTASVRTLTAFDDGLASQWDRHDRPGARLAVEVTGSFFDQADFRISILDSNFQQVFPGASLGAGASNLDEPPGDGDPDNPGMRDPSVGRVNRVPTFDGITLVGGQVYYLIVDAAVPGGTGRYNISMTADAGPRRVVLNRDGTLTADAAFAPADMLTALPILPTAFGANRTQITGVQAREESRATDFNGALRRVVGPFGDMDIEIDRSSGAILFNEAQHRKETPSTRTAALLEGGQGIISTIDDTDLYFFRAATTGFAEIRLSTSGISDSYRQSLIDYRLAYPPIAGRGAVTVESEVTPIGAYESNLDASIRVFSNDFSQIAYNDDNPAFAFTGAGDRMLSGVIGNLQGQGLLTDFNRRDPRVVFPVLADQVYFIQVESSQRWRVANPPEFYDNIPDATDPRVANTDPEIDWRYATGSYQLQFNTMAPQVTDLEDGQIVVDDHSDVLGTSDVAGYLATPIVIGTNPQVDKSDGLGRVTGVINNTPNRPIDIDSFKFINPGSNSVTVTLSRDTGSTLVSSLQVYRNGTLAGEAVNQGNGRFTLTTQAAVGEQFIIQVTGVAASEGAYVVTVSTGPTVDDFGEKFRWWEATEVSLEDASGSGFIAGRIDREGDTDLFKVEFTDFDLAVFTVRPLDPTLRPRITVYEVSEIPVSGAGAIIHPFHLQIASTSRTEAPPVGQDVSVRASVRSPRQTQFASPNDRVYSYYYVVVEGFDPTTDVGRYELSIDFGATDDHADAPAASATTYSMSQIAFASPIIIDAFTGTGSRGGVLEVSGDTDLFTFEVAASGPVTINLQRPAGSTFRGRVSIVDSTGVLLGTRGELGDDLSLTPVSASVAFVTRGTRLYVVVEPTSPNTATTRTGAYTLNVFTPSVDDHANRGEYPLATPIAILASNGRGQIGGSAAGQPGNPRINSAGDTDLFSFFSLAVGSYTVTVTPLSSTSSGLRPRVEVYQAIFNAQGVEIGQNFLGAMDAMAALGEAVFTFNASQVLSRYYALVVPQSGGDNTGEYRIAVQGPLPTVNPPGQDTGDIDFNAPTTIVLNQRTGDGSTLRQGLRPQLPEINPAGDRDLYSFTTSAPGRVFVRLSLPQGSTLLGRIDVFRRNSDQSLTLVGSDEVNNFGSASKLDFPSAANIEYLVIVDAPGDSTGSYVLEVDTQPLVNQLVYPEGYATDLISEFIPIVNPNPFPISYTVKLYYSFADANGGRLVDTFPTRVIGAQARDGVTINAPINGQIVQEGPVRQNVPYSLVVEYSYPNTFVNGQGQTVAVDPANIQPLGATLSHYDFGSSTGDAFTDRVSDRWAFPRLERQPGSTLNYVVVWNPQDYAVDMQLVAYMQDGRQIVLPGAGQWRRVEGNRREGFGIDDFAELGTGIFSAVLQTRVSPEANGTTDPAKAAVFEGVVAAVSAYRLGAGQEAAFGAIGDAEIGNRRGVITNLTQGNGVTSEIVIFNPNQDPATVTLSSQFIRTGIAGFSRVVQVGPGRSTVIAASTLGITPGQPVGITYSSNLDVSVQSVQFQRGDADSASSRYAAGTRFLFGDAFIDARTAGRLYFETLWFYNPTNVQSTVDIRLVFFNNPSQSTSTITVNLPARGFGEVRLHERQEILNVRGPVWFAIDAQSRGGLPFMMTMEHYDLFLGGGWSASGVPFGIQVPLDQIS